MWHTSFRKKLLFYFILCFMLFIYFIFTLFYFIFYSFIYYFFVISRLTKAADQGLLARTSFRFLVTGEEESNHDDFR